MHLETDMLMTSWNVGNKSTRYPGIFKTESGFRVRVRATDPRTNTRIRCANHTLIARVLVPTLAG
jgi:hypothetical protein